MDDSASGAGKLLSTEGSDWSGHFTQISSQHGKFKTDQFPKALKYSKLIFRDVVSVKIFLNIFGGWGCASNG